MKPWDDWIDSSTEDLGKSSVNSGPDPEFVKSQMGKVQRGPTPVGQFIPTGEVEQETPEQRRKRIMGSRGTMGSMGSKGSTTTTGRAWNDVGYSISDENLRGW